MQAGFRPVEQYSPVTTTPPVFMYLTIAHAECFVLSSGNIRYYRDGGECHTNTVHTHTHAAPSLTVDYGRIH